LLIPGETACFACAPPLVCYFIYLNLDESAGFSIYYVKMSLCKVFLFGCFKICFYIAGDLDAKGFYFDYACLSTFNKNRSRILYKCNVFLLLLFR
jgi:hypothetical protein